VPAILHRLLNGFAWTVRLGILPSLTRFAGLFYGVLQRLSWGEHRGGMFVDVVGTTLAGERIERSWHLLAEGEDGPFIPSMAAEAIIRRCLAGRAPAAGARSAANDLQLADYDVLFARRAISTGRREKPPDSHDMPIYHQILGDAWSALPAPLQIMHDLRGSLTAQGIATVERGRGLFARLIAVLFGFPKSGRDVPVTVEFERKANTETWRRTFADRSFSSVQEAGRGRYDHLIVERFGPFAFGFAVVLADGKLRLILRRWSFFGVSMPMWLAPRSKAYEYAAAGRFHFHVELGHALTGLIV